MFRAYRFDKDLLKSMEGIPISGVPMFHIFDYDIILNYVKKMKVSIGC